MNQAPVQDNTSGVINRMKGGVGGEVVSLLKLLPYSCPMGMRAVK